MRLIDADALRFNKGIRRFIQIDRYTGAWPCILLADLCDARKVPTIEAEPVKHGYNARGEGVGMFECSVCGYEDYDTITCEPEHHNYCPNCGAKMDLEAPDEA